MQWYFPLWSKWEYCFTVWARLRVREADMGANNNQTVWALTGPGAAVMMTGRVLLSYFTGSVTYTLTGNRSNSEIAESPRSKFVDKIFVFLSQAEIRTQQFKLNKLLHRPHNVIYYYIYLMTWSWFKYLGSCCYAWWEFQSIVTVSPDWRSWNHFIWGKVPSWSVALPSNAGSLKNLLWHSLLSR